MGNIINLFPQNEDARKRLLDFASDDAELKKLINKMSDEQLAKADKRLTNSLCEFVDVVEKSGGDFEKLMADIKEREQNMLHVLAMLDYAVKVCAAVPKNNPTDDDIDNAYKRILATEMHRFVEKAIREVGEVK
jgi:hypothetical protein